VTATIADSPEISAGKIYHPLQKAVARLKFSKD
jgi:hypothetical protein